MAYRELRRKLERLLDTHLRGDGYGAPRTGRALIKQLKEDPTVGQLGPAGSEALQKTLDQFLQVQPELNATPIRVQFAGPYSESKLIESAEEVAETITQFRDAFRTFAKTECGPYF